MWSRKISCLAKAHGLKISTLCAVLAVITNSLIQVVPASAQSSTPANHEASLSTNSELSINGFRNPSIGLEYRKGHTSFHAGYYPTIFSSGGESQSYTTSFIRTGISVWYAPFKLGSGPLPSALYSSASWLWGQSHDYSGVHALQVETGFRLMIWQGLQARLGIAATMAPGKPTHINPTPGISYSIPF